MTTEEDTDQYRLISEDLGTVFESDIPHVEKAQTTTKSRNSFDRARHSGRSDHRLSGEWAKDRTRYSIGNVPPDKRMSEDSNDQRLSQSVRSDKRKSRDWTRDRARYSLCSVTSDKRRSGEWSNDRVRYSLCSMRSDKRISGDWTNTRGRYSVCSVRSDKRVSGEWTSCGTRYSMASVRSDAHLSVDWSTEPWVTAAPLDPLYRYHVYFSHSPEDTMWVEQIANQLTAPPFGYRCHYSNRRQSDGDTTNCLKQTTLCAAILSEIVAIVLSPRYVGEPWSDFRQTLDQMTSSSLLKQRMFVIVLEDCEVPLQLCHVTSLDSKHPSFLRCLLNALKSDRLPRSSVSVGHGDVLLSRSSVSNGNLLCTVTGNIQGRCQATLQFDAEEVPSALSCHGINLTFSEFSHIIHAIGNKSRAGRQLSWLYTWKPLIIIAAICFVWLIAFVLVIVLLLDAPTSSTLPIRLPVFVFPFVFVLLAYFLRWKRRQKYTNLAMQMFNKCVEVNQTLYDEGKSLVLSSARTETDVFHIYFMYYNIADCVRSLAERMCTILSAPYAQRLLFGLNPRVDHNRQHVVGKNQCLCQFVKEFVSDYLTKLEKQKLDEPDEMFSNYVNLSLRKNSMKTVQELITMPSEDLSHIT